MHGVARAGTAALAFVLMGFSAEDAKQALNGQWRSADLVLSIDVRTAEATLADAQGNQRERFELKKVVGNTVLFTVGDKRLVGSLAEDQLVVTVGNDPFTQTLKRIKPDPSPAPGLATRESEQAGENPHRTMLSHLAEPGGDRQDRRRGYTITIRSAEGVSYRVLTIHP